MPIAIRAVLVALLSSLASPAFAQGPVGVGVKVGFGVSDLKFRLPLDSTTNLVAGGTLRMRLGELVSFQAEGLFARKAVTARDNVFGVPFRLGVDYLEAPILVVFTAPTRGMVHPFAFAGPAPAFKLRANALVDNVRDRDLEHDVEGLDFSFVVGGGVEVAHIEIEARYALGLININGNPDFPENVAKTRMFSVLVGRRW